MSCVSLSYSPLPVPELNQVLGLVGPHRIGKTNVLNILSGKLLPNFGRADNDDQLLPRFRCYDDDVNSQVINHYSNPIIVMHACVLSPAFSLTNFSEPCFQTASLDLPSEVQLPLV